MNVQANIGNMIEIYKVEFKNNILGQSGVKHFYYLKGIRFCMNELGLSDSQIQSYENEVFESLIAEGFSEYVESYKNEDYEKNWNRLAE